MGLTERRLIQEHTDTLFPKVQAEWQQACGGPVEVSAEWEGFESDAAALERLSMMCFDRLLTAVGWVCKDEVGKQAVRDRIRNVVVRNVGAPADKRMELADGVLTISGRWAGDWDGAFHENEYHKFLESHL